MFLFGIVLVNLEIIETEAVFTQTEMNKEGNVNFHRHSAISFQQLFQRLKLLFWYSVKLISGLFLISNMSSNLNLENNFQFKKLIKGLSLVGICTYKNLCFAPKMLFKNYQNWLQNVYLNGHWLCKKLSRNQFVIYIAQK